MRYTLAVFGFCLSIAASAQAADTVTLPFFDDFTSTVDGKVNPRLWQPSGVYVNSAYTDRQQTMMVASFDILDGSGRVYAAASGGRFAADTLTSHVIAIPDSMGGRKTDSVYISFSFMPGGKGDMPEQEDSLLLYFFEPQEQQWYLAWSASTNASLSAGCDTVTQHLHLVRSDGFSTVVTEIKNQWDDSKFITAMVKVPTGSGDHFCDPGFRFRFVNMASRAAGEVSGMQSNCDMWHIDYIYLNASRNPNNTAIADVSIQKPSVSFLQKYTAMPWRHLTGNRTAQRDVLPSSADGRVYLPFFYCNLSPLPTSINVDMQLRLTTGGVWERNYDNIESKNIYGNTTMLLEPYVSSTEMLEAPDSDADSVGIEVRFTLRQYRADPEIASFLTHNDTSIFLQKFYDYYAYDDGSSENGYGIFGENAQGAEIAVKYHAYRRDTLTGVQIYFNHTVDTANLQPFLLTVWAGGAEPGKVIYQDNTREPSQAQFDGLNRFVWYKFNRFPIVVEGDFFVGIKQLNTAMANIGVDANNLPPAQTTFVRMGAFWQPSQVDSIGALMIRPSFARCTWRDEVETYAPFAMPDIKFTIYPNPARSKIHISLSDEFDYTSLTIKVLDVMGRNVLRIPFAATVNVGALPAGIYWLCLEDARGNTIGVEKFAVAK
jgi:hypothetical protein